MIQHSAVGYRQVMTTTPDQPATANGTPDESGDSGIDPTEEPDTKTVSEQDTADPNHAPGADPRPDDSDPDR